MHSTKGDILALNLSFQTKINEIRYIYGLCQIGINSIYNDLQKLILLHGINMVYVSGGSLAHSSSDNPRLSSSCILGIQNLDCRIQSSEFRVQNLDCRIQSLEFRIYTVEFRVQNLEFRVQNLDFRLSLNLLCCD